MIPSILPPFDLLQQNYNVTHYYDMALISRSDVYTYGLGNEIAEYNNTRTNTCCLRLSEAFNYAGCRGVSLSRYKSGYRISKIIHSEVYIPTDEIAWKGGDYKIQRNQGARVMKGGDQLNYIYTVVEFKTYLKTLYGKPNIIAIKINTRIDVNDFKGKRGVIVFSVSGWNDATGHVSLWDGQKVVYESMPNEYFGMNESDHFAKKHTYLKKAQLWIC